MAGGGGRWGNLFDLDDGERRATGWTRKKKVPTATTVKPVPRATSTSAFWHAEADLRHNPTPGPLPFFPLSLRLTVTLAFFPNPNHSESGTRMVEQ